MVVSSVSSRCTTEDEDVVFAWLLRGGSGRSDDVLLSFEGGVTRVK